MRCKSALFVHFFAEWARCGRGYCPMCALRAHLGPFLRVFPKWPNLAILRLTPLETPGFSSFLISESKMVTFCICTRVFAKITNFCTNLHPPGPNGQIFCDFEVVLCFCTWFFCFFPCFRDFHPLSLEIGLKSCLSPRHPSHTVVRLGLRVREVSFIRFIEYW